MQSGVDSNSLATAVAWLMAFNRVGFLLQQASSGCRNVGSDMRFASDSILDLLQAGEGDGFIGVTTPW